MDLDFSSLWSWTIPLWGLFVLVLFLGGVMMEVPVLESIQSAVQRGGSSKRVRFALP